MTTAEWKAEKKAQGLCLECFKAPRGETSKCEPCREQARTRDELARRSRGERTAEEYHARQRAEAIRRRFMEYRVEDFSIVSQMLELSKVMGRSRA